MGLVRGAGVQPEVHTDMLSMLWGLDCLCGFQIILEIGSEYFSMNAVIDYDPVSARVSDRKANG